MGQDTASGIWTGSAGDLDASAKALNGLRVAVVHYWFIGYGGGERVIEALAELFPRADFFALVASDRGIPPGLNGRSITTSFVNHIPGAKRWYRHFLPLYPFALEQFDLSGYDLVISSESGPAKGVITSPRACHICYCHTPMRYLWDMYHEYQKAMNPLARAIFALTAHYVRQWDVSTAARVDYFVANSEHVAARVRKYYRRESIVIHPPVDVSLRYISKEIDNYYLIVSRLVPYKRVDLAIEACNRLRRTLRIVGTGPEYKRLRKLAGPTIEFLGKLDEKPLRECYSRARALLFPAEEDFGIVPVEAQSFGRPVIAYGRGGALETVIGLNGSGDAASATGVLFEEQTGESLIEAILEFEKHEAAFSRDFIRDNARRFSKERFKEEFTRFVAGRLSAFHVEGFPRGGFLDEPAQSPVNSAEVRA